MFAALHLTPYADTKVMILGQDPYHGPKQAHGLCFSVQRGVRVPPSLVNIHKELATDLGVPIPTHGNLEHWARQGVLLLNTTLTVRAGQAASHQGKGWETFTDQVIRTVSDKPDHVVFILWGASARRKRPLIDGTRHTIIESAHPSPLSAHNGFFGSRPFSRANAGARRPRPDADRLEPGRNLMAWTTSDRVVALRQRSVAVDVVVDMLDGWRRHQSGRNASLLSFFFFLSIFPLLLVATTILGFVLQNNEDLQQRIVNGALDQIPVLGEQLANDPTSLNGSVWVLIAGLLTALWSATKAFVGLQVALDDIWEIPIDEREAMPVQRFRAVLGLVIIGVSQIGSLAVSAIVNAAELPNLSRILLLLAGLVVNIAVLAFMYRLLTAASPTWRDVWPGAIAAGIAFSLLQYFGSGIVNRITENASDTYGQFALVLALVTWLGFLAISALMAGELNAALVRRRTPAVTPL